MKQQFDVNYFARKLTTRAGFLSLSMAAMASAGGLVVGIPIVGYILGPVINQPKNRWRDARLTSPDGTLGEIVLNDDGTVAGGPAARPLPRYPVRVKRGRVQVHTEPLPVSH